MDQCFVCLDEAPPLLRVCACADRKVHILCQRRLVRKVASHSAGTCPVCNAVYTNAVPTRRLYVRGDKCLLCCVLLACCISTDAIFLVLLLDFVRFGNTASMYASVSIGACAVATNAISAGVIYYAKPIQIVRGCKLNFRQAPLLPV